MSNSKTLAQLKEKRNNLQVLESAQEIAVFSGTLVGIFCAGVWLGSFVPRLDARRVAQTGIGVTMTLVGAAWFGHNQTTKKLDQNWEEITQLKQEMSKVNNSRKCAKCKYFNKANELLLGCAVNPSMPANCPDFEDKNQVSFQDPSGLNVVAENCSVSEIEEIQQIVYRVFNS